MRKPFKTGPDCPNEPATVAAILLFKHPNRLVAMCAEGIFYHWQVQPAKQQALAALKEGDLVFVNYNTVTGDVYSIVGQS